MRRLVFIIIFPLLLVPTLSWGKKDSAPPEYFIVTKVLYGDTIVLDDGRTIRLIGVLAPKVKNPNSLVEKWQNESIEFVKSLVLEQPVWLEFDKKAPSDSNDTWAYVYFNYPYPDSRKKWEWIGQVPVLLTPGEYLLNRMVVQYGYGTENSPFNFKYRTQFSQLENDARNKNHGLWGSHY